MLSLINQYTVALDACVLAPMPICDTLLRLAEEPAVYIPKWSAEILGEVRSTLIKMGYPEPKAERRISVMREAFEDAEVSGFERLVPALTNHEKDRHVLAAAIQGKAHAIVTANTSHFPPEAVTPYDIEVLTPDEFLVHQFHLEPEIIIEKIRGQATDIEVPLPALLSKLHRTAPDFVKSLAVAINSD